MTACIRGIATRFRQHRKKIVVAFSSMAILIAALFWWSDRACRAAAAGRVFQSVAEVPQNDIALVLGTSRTTPRGSTNLHFNQRIAAAAALYHAGKVRHLLVSGDNHVAGYDEPTDMRDALVAAGVPASAITLDYAGFRTLDSVVRAKLVFGLQHCTIVTEEFHCPRALWIARQNGIDAVAFAAPDLKSARWTLRVKARECFARAWCGIDLYVLHRGPKFPGPREPIVLTASAR
jgi:SanA protein